jgi:hypothetical protein
MTALEVLTAIKDALAAIPLDVEGDPSGEKLFEAVELYPNQQIGRALQSLLKTTAKRACLVVPMGVRRATTSGSGAISVTGVKSIEVAIVYSDQAYFKYEQLVTFGSDKNVGLLGFDDKIEAALTGQEISPLGAIVLGDSDPIYLTVAEQKDAPGRQAWLVQALVPVDLIATETF